MPGILNRESMSTAAVILYSAKQRSTKQYDCNPVPHRFGAAIPYKSKARGVSILIEHLA